MVPCFLNDSVWLERIYIEGILKTHTFESCSSLLVCTLLENINNKLIVKKILSNLTSLIFRLLHGTLNSTLWCITLICLFLFTEISFNDP